MPSIHIHLNSHADCGVNARHGNARHARQNDLRQGLAAMPVLAMPERIVNAATPAANLNAALRFGDHH